MNASQARCRAGVSLLNAEPSPGLRLRAISVDQGYTPFAAHLYRRSGVSRWKRRRLRTLRRISCNMLRSDRGCGAGEESGDRVRTKFIQTMTRQSPEGA